MKPEAEDAMGGAGYNEGFIRERYREETRDRAVRIGTLAALPSIPIVFFFTWIDLGGYLQQVPFTITAVRLYCIACALLLFASSVLFPEMKRLNFRLFYLFTTSFLFVLSVRVGFFAGTPHYERVIYGTSLAVFIAFVMLPGGLVSLLPAYGVATALMIISLAAAGNLGSHWTTLVNPVTLMAACSVISQLQENDRFRGFAASLTVENQSALIKADSDKLEAINRRLMLDMVLARQIQYTLIPVKAPPVPGVRIAGMYLPVDAIGGDYYDYITFDDGDRLGIFICDVSGHGIPAALITCMVKTVVSSAGAEKESPSEFLRFINARLVDQVSGNFLTAFYGIYDGKKREFRYARAGHSFPFLVRGGVVNPLKGKGSMLGLDREASFEDRTIVLLPGDRILFYSDGLIEAADERGEMFEEKLVSVVLPSLSFLPPDVMVNTLFSRLVQFHGLAEFEDDICMIGFEVTDDVS